MKPITDNDLLALIPQKPPFVMISELVNANEKNCTTKFATNVWYKTNQYQ